LQATKRFVNLRGRHGAGAPVIFGHQEHALAVAVLERLTHTDFAGAVMIIARVIEERDASIDSAPHNADAPALLLRHAHVIAAQTESGNTLAGGPEVSIDHPVGCLRIKLRGDLKSREHCQQFASFHVS
jgi:hypothetical protein